MFSMLLSGHIFRRVCLTLTLVLAVSALQPMQAHSSVSFWQLPLAEKLRILPELEPVFRPTGDGKVDWQGILENSERVASECPPSSTAALYARFMGVMARGNLLCTPIETPDGGRRFPEIKTDELKQLRASLVQLSEDVSKIRAASNCWIVNELSLMIQSELAFHDLQLGNYDRAIEGYAKVIESDRSSWLAREAAAKIALAFIYKKDPDGGLAFLDSIARRHADVPTLVYEARLGSAMICHRLGADRDRAASFCRAAIDSVTDDKLIRKAERLISNVFNRDRNE